MKGQLIHHFFYISDESKNILSIEKGDQSIIDKKEIEEYIKEKKELYKILMTFLEDSNMIVQFYQHNISKNRDVY